MVAILSSLILPNSCFSYLKLQPMARWMVLWVKVYTAHRICKLASLLWILCFQTTYKKDLHQKGKSINTNPQRMYTCKSIPIPPRLDRTHCTPPDSQHYHIMWEYSDQVASVMGTTVLAYLSLEQSFSKHHPAISHLLSTSCNNSILYVNYANGHTNKSPLILSFCTQELMWNHLREISIVPQIRKHCIFWFHKDT